MISLKTLPKLLLTISFIFIINYAMGQDRQLGSLEQTKLVVKKIDGIKEYSSTIDLNDDRKQLLMAGQNYQTNYGIYASIEIGKSSLGTNYKTLKNIEFEIVNYKPTYFIGIDSIIVAANQMRNGLTFKIYTRALSDNNTYVLNEADLKSIHFENGSYLHSERYLNPMFPEKNAEGKVLFDSDGRVTCQPDNGKAFDFEFFYKDAYLVVKKENYDQKTEVDQLYKNEEAFSMPGRRCKESFNKVMF